MTSQDAKKAIGYLEKQLPPAVFSNPLSDETEAVVEIPASKKLLPQMFDRTERKLENREEHRQLYYPQVPPNLKYFLKLIYKIY